MVSESRCLLMKNTLNTAFLSNNGEYTFFKFRDPYRETIRKI